ncbi:hypothetical protein FB451DRAFT_1549284 [Mycena latifolia]|nr:hypothetical protein FB451DRAFT_1549284 [Mycena latifolia]
MLPGEYFKLFMSVFCSVSPFVIQANPTQSAVLAQWRLAATQHLYSIANTTLTVVVATLRDMHSEVIYTLNDLRGDAIQPPAPGQPLCLLVGTEAKDCGILSHVPLDVWAHTLRIRVSLSLPVACAPRLCLAPLPPLVLATSVPAKVAEPSTVTVTATLMITTTVQAQPARHIHTLTLTEGALPVTATIVVERASPTAQSPSNVEDAQIPGRFARVGATLVSAGRVWVVAVVLAVLAVCIIGWMVLKFSQRRRTDDSLNGQQHGMAGLAAPPNATLPPPAVLPPPEMLPVTLAEQIPTVANVDDPESAPACDTPPRLHPANERSKALSSVVAPPSPFAPGTPGTPVSPSPTVPSAAGSLSATPASATLVSELVSQGAASSSSPRSTDSPAAASSGTSPGDTATSAVATMGTEPRHWAVQTIALEHSIAAPQQVEEEMGATKADISVQQGPAGNGARAVESTGSRTAAKGPSRIPLAPTANGADASRDTRERTQPASAKGGTTAKEGGGAPLRKVQNAIARPSSAGPHARPPSSAQSHRSSSARPSTSSQIARPSSTSQNARRSSAAGKGKGKSGATGAAQR